MKIKEEYAQRIKWFTDSPDVGDPSCICSLCGEQVPEEDLPIRLWNDNHDPTLEARFHEDCFKKIIES